MPDETDLQKKEREASRRLEEALESGNSEDEKQDDRDEDGRD